MSRNGRFLASLQRAPWLQAPRLSKKGRTLAVKFLEALGDCISAISEAEGITRAKAYDRLMTLGLNTLETEALTPEIFDATQKLGPNLQEYAVLCLASHHSWPKRPKSWPRTSPFKALVKLYQCGYAGDMKEGEQGEPKRFLLIAKDDRDAWLVDAPKIPLSSALPLFQNLP